ncbi:TPA: site-specific integrase [Vibrio parahaemolyticus]|uniref:Site-specific integrase n=1 Tax=Vibrio diabolicus TaxID=50719 RepID=A0AA92LSW7_9VIBR|nr:site-specific integrase [Vibrio diabolicus]MCG6238961.1 hypothetical protein [Vibrio diabolicus]NWK16028.1 site-specific integrase [Vibrio parahaemolyticus]QRG83343.1 site-specific integrase [Vibrio diabolicus]HBC3449913.1 site-specific integrase [Vibrio parahaemolyticus]
MQTSEIVLEVVLVEDFKIGNRKLGKMPFVMDSNGYPHQLINEFLLSYEAITMKRDVEKTVTPKARHIVRVYNDLNKIIYTNPELESCSHFDDEDDVKEAFHNLWHTSSESILLMVQSNMKEKGDVENSTINARLSAFCHFLYWAEEKGYCEGVIGINNLEVREGKDGYRIPVSTVPPKSKARFSIPWRLPDNGSSPKPMGMIGRHDRAYAALMEKGNTEKSVIIAMRDLLLLRVMRECGLRREEAATLDAAEFCRKDPVYNDLGDKIYCKTSATKGADKDARIFPCPVELYFEIQVFAESVRLDLVPKKYRNQRGGYVNGFKEPKKLFISTETGDHIKPNTVNKILKPYGINPHSSRKTAFTEICMGLIDIGYSKKECLFILGEIAGHSIKSEGKTVDRYYLIAEEMRKGAVPNAVSLQYQLRKAELRVKELEKQLATQK